MAACLTRESIESLAVLRAISEWQTGAFGPLRIHKTLFFADKGNDLDWTLFTFKRWYLGQYSDTIAAAMNRLRNCGRIRSAYDGPSERIRAVLSPVERGRLRALFATHFSKWTRGFKTAFSEWAYLTNDQIVRKAHDDPSYTISKHGEIILESRLPELVEFSDLSDDEAESLTDMVDDRLQTEIASRLARAVNRKVRAEDWKHIYFDGV